VKSSQQAIINSSNRFKKPNLNIRKGNYYAGTLEAFHRIWKEEGLRAFYRGASASVLGTLHVCVYFPLYEHLKLVLSSDKHRQSLSVGLASASSKLLATSLTYPHEVIRTRLQTYQTQHNTFMATVKWIWINEGIAGFYRGLSINIVRAVPAAAITFIVYEKTLNHLTS
jgi:solute carrier family 25 folate transporter 32